MYTASALVCFRNVVEFRNGILPLRNIFRSIQLYHCYKRYTFFVIKMNCFGVPVGHKHLLHLHYSITPHFYIIKLVCTGVYNMF